MPYMQDWDVAIIGGGAAGLATAIFAARRAPGRRIIVLDGAKKLGAKILVSGGGRCNVTNVRVTPDDYSGGSRHTIRRIIDVFSVGRTMLFFSEIGVSLHEEEHGKLFPDTNSAETVLNALTSEATRLGVVLALDHRVAAINRHSDTFALITPHGIMRAIRCVLATGGRSLPKTGSDGGGYELARSLGHTIAPTIPALVPLYLDGDFHAPLSGVTLDVELIGTRAGAKPIRVQGAMLWTHFGASGPAILDISRHWHAARLEGESLTLTANFCPGQTFESLDAQLTSMGGTQPRSHVPTCLAGMIPARLAGAVLSHLHVPVDRRMAHLSKDERRAIARALTAWPLPVRDSRGYNFAEVTAGGVPLSEITPATLESRCCPGLFLVGEILDVDGRLGGFNFQWAWSSGWVAGNAVADRSTSTATDGNAA